jgi:hypothetical protein
MEGQNITSSVQRAKYAVEVVAGLIPGQPMPEFTKQFWVTSDEWRSLPTLESIQDKWGEANQYAESLMNPDRLNWVQISWVWF